MHKNKLFSIILISSLSLFADQNIITVKNDTNANQNINNLQNKALVKTIAEISTQKEKIQANRHKIKKLENQISELKNKISVLEQLSKKNHATIIKIKMLPNSKNFPEVSSSVFQLSNNKEKGQASISANYIVKTWGANVRQGPSVKYKIVKQLKKGDKVLVTKKSKDNWFFLPVDNGWMSHITIKKIK